MTNLGRKLSRAEFEELVADAASEREALESGRPVPKATARRRPRPRPVVKLPPPPKARKVPAPANDNPRPMPVKASTNSTPERIVNALPPELRRTLNRLRELTRPAEVAVPEMVLAAANDNACDSTGVGIDHRHDFTPGDITLSNVDDFIEAYADGMRSRVVTTKGGRMQRFVGGVKYHKSVKGSGEIVEVGGRSSDGKFFGIRIHRGTVVAYAKDGKLRVPSYELGDPRGSDDAEMPRETSASPPAHHVLAEMARADAFDDFCTRVPIETARLLAVILNADSFREVATAAGLSATSHNGRRTTEKMLLEAKKLMAA